ncbi:MAG: GNAT family N-acetyltransferase [Pyrinomonadaceae bacterium]
MILATERLILRELDSAIDAEFVFALLNTPKFLQYIGDRGVRSVDEAAVFVEDRYRQSYRDHGFGLYAVELRSAGSATEDTLPTGRVSASNTQIGLCGFVKRDHFESPDIGFAFLPEHEGKGYGFESARAVLDYGKHTLGFSRVLAITSQDNDVSGKLLEKLGFAFDGVKSMPDGEMLKVFSIQL